MSLPWSLLPYIIFIRFRSVNTTPRAKRNWTHNYLRKEYGCVQTPMDRKHRAYNRHQRIGRKFAPRRAVAERTDTASRAISRRSDLARLRDLALCSLGRLRLHRVARRHPHRIDGVREQRVIPCCLHGGAPEASEDFIVDERAEDEDGEPDELQHGELLAVVRVGAL